jgi:hypothetical protein
MAESAHPWRALAGGDALRPVQAEAQCLAEGESDILREMVWPRACLVAAGFDG